MSDNRERLDCCKIHSLDHTLYIFFQINTKNGKEGIRMHMPLYGACSEEQSVHPVFRDVTQYKG